MPVSAFGVDDDSVMHKLFNELDVLSAIDRLMRVGFMLKKEINPNIYQFTRMSVKGNEALQLLVNESNHFVLTLIDFNDGEHSETVSTWDQWVDFVRMLLVRWFAMAKIKKAEDS